MAEDFKTFREVSIAIGGLKEQLAASTKPFGRR
jgi:hypothetical protein